MNVRGLILLLIAVVAGAVWMLGPSAAVAGPTSKIEVRQLEAGVLLGRPGVKVRLTLQSGQAVEFRTEDPAEAETTLRMADAFLSGRGRMYAELEGNNVQSLQVAGPIARVAQ